MQSILSDTFGFDRFRPGQAEIVEAAIAGDDLLAIMPTGGGKSLCFQLPALMQDGLTLVISPLIALMRDQVSQLQALGVAASSLNSTNSEEENQATFVSARNGSLKLLYISPERLARPGTLDFLRNIHVATIAVDEAHCVSQWGHDFRPEYRQIGRVRDALGKVQMLGFTATADALTRKDIAEKLFRAVPKIFQHGFDRPNISLAMTPRNNAKKQLLAFLADHRGESGIVYCQSRKRVEEHAQFLLDNGLRALPYHAGLAKDVRADNQDAFLREDGIIIVATVAFGMGIDKPDVRFVFHLDLPKNIESYYQEIGRAGRDNLAAATRTLYGLNEIRQYRQWIDEGEASEEQKRIEHQKLSSLVALCEAPKCRRMTLLAYFGDECEPCGNCDLCNGEVEMRDGTIDAQKALSAIIRTGEFFGMEHLISVLRGEDNEMSRKHGHAALPTFGVGKDTSRVEWRSIFRQLYAAGLVWIDASRFNRWVVSEAGWRVLRQKETVMLRQQALVAKQTKERKQPAAMADCDAAVFAALKEHRLMLAREKSVPAFVIFPDRSLIDMAAKLPDSLEAMGSIHGVGAKKLEQYGEEFLAVIKQAIEKPESSQDA